MEGWRFRKSERSACWNASSILGGFLSRSRGGVGRERQRCDAAHREDTTLMREVMEAVRQAIPDASSQQPGAVLEHVLGALRQADAKTVNCPDKER